MWEQSGLPADVCEVAKPADQRSEVAKYLWKFGLYRRLDSGKVEFIPYCVTVQNAQGVQIPAAQNYTNINTQKMKAWLDALLPEPASAP